MTTQTEAERLADALTKYLGGNTAIQAAAELRRLVSFNNQLIDEVARLQKREWVGLTDEDVMSLVPITGHRPATTFARNVEAKLKEKNT